MNNIVAATASYAAYLNRILDGATLTLYHTYNIGCTRSRIGPAVYSHLISLKYNSKHLQHV